ncbi:Ribonucleoside-diphosphate reductase large subunit [Camellia lanceoleosa]|uniref:Ribonucleoside-diphosphate reductase large subunit n=1 Tax=Camellia lanceoleosa TaxID=1840588 RepID=A0ACC0F1Y4_9ERIC|nr:Ribonucleoside-diphosphate reductase large subunit [Camellia lanceoleosa]
MSEIFAKSFATGAFARSSRQGVPISDDEREMNERFYAYMSGKGVVDESCTFGSKRKSNGQEESSGEDKDDDEAKMKMKVKVEVKVQMKLSCFLTMILQVDMWAMMPSDRWNWTTLREMISKNGVRNSLLVARTIVKIEEDEDDTPYSVVTALNLRRYKHKNTGQKEAASNSSEEAIVYVKSEDEFFIRYQFIAILNLYHVHNQFPD